MALASVFVVLALLFSIIVMAVLNLENRKQAGELVEYESQGWFRECAVWDADNRRFVVSFIEGGLGQIGETGKEETLVKDPDYAGNATLGFKIDSPRNRIVVAVAEAIGGKYGALAAYDMATWQRLFLTQLSGPGDAKSLADDVAVDPEGNTYVTDAVGNKIWKVGRDGALVAVFSNPVFSSVPHKVPLTTVGLNGIVYHPGGYLLVVHTSAGVLFKVSLDGKHVTRVNMSGLVLMGDGLVLLTPERLVVAGIPSARIVESNDDWRSAKLTHRYVGPMNRWATAATVKDGKVFVSHMLGFGLRKRTHVITEAVFKEVKTRPPGLVNNQFFKGRSSD